DPARIGVIGFSFGGVAAMLAATRKFNGPFLGAGCFAAIMPVYPICHLYNRLPGFEFADLTDAPLLIVTGALDGYDDDPEAGPTLAAALTPGERERVRTEVIAGAHHGFDLPGADWVVEDPAGHRGAGGKLSMTYNAAAAARAHELAATFFSQALKPG
ncbi:MAG: dienelactone hydrolase family protein, partial [Caulobacteraceae bacterium]